MSNPWTIGPWFGEGFEQTEGAGHFYGGLIMGADNETIVAQCVMPQDMPIIAAAPEMAHLLAGTTNAFMAVLLEHLAARLVMHGVPEDDDPVVEARSRAVKIRALLARIRGETT